MGAAVKGERQLQHVLEVGREDALAAAMCEPVRVQRHKCPAQDAEQRKTAPGNDQHVEPLSDRMGERIDDAAEQHRLRELRAGQRQVGEREQPSQPGFVAEQAQHTRIKLYQFHLQLPRPKPTFVMAGLVPAIPLHETPGSPKRDRRDKPDDDEEREALINWL